MNHFLSRTTTRTITSRAFGHLNKSTMMRIVIVGGGQAGINCAQNLAKTLTDADNTEVVVLE
ncbi:hypothetical protein PF007_g30355, partial [Phytophthora fragariae]